MTKYSRKPRTVKPYTVPPTVGAGALVPDTTTHQGGPGFSRDPKAELFLLAVTNMGSEATFYETAEHRDDRFRDLVETVTRIDPAWMARFVPFLRNTMQMRSASVVAAAEYALAMRNRVTQATHPDYPSVRSVVASAMSRADEPAEFIGYWIQRTGRRTLPGGVQRGVADAVARLYTERAALKYDGGSRGIRMGDVLELTHPTPSAPWQAALFEWLLGARHRGTDNTASRNGLPMINDRLRLEGIPKEQRRGYLSGLLASGVTFGGGVTWEWLSGWLPGGMDREAWEAVIPDMGYMALLRNLRNFDNAGVSDDVALKVAEKLSDPDEVRASRQFPMRFLSAYRAAPSLRWSWPLEQALNLSLGNVPSLTGRTLVLVDRSGSMWDRLSGRSDLNRADAAAVFGSAIALRAGAGNADLVQFGTDSRAVSFRDGDSVLRIVQRFTDLGGTQTHAAVRRHFRQGWHDRVIILTDEQASYGYGETQGVGDLIPADVPLYTWNLAGYRAGHTGEGWNRFTFGGLTDAGFRMIPLLEAGVNAIEQFDRPAVAGE